MDISKLLSASVTPVVLISACGLVTLALYNRLGLVLSRIRAFHTQKMNLLKEIDQLQGEDKHLLLKMINSQIEKVTRKASVVQLSLYSLLSAVVAFLMCSFFAALAALQLPFSEMALAMHFLGLFLFLTGIGFAIRELTLSLSPLDEENAYLEFFSDNLDSKWRRTRD